MLSRPSERTPQVEAEFEAFCLARERIWLADYALFRVLMELNGERETWDDWRPEHYEHRRCPPLARFVRRREHALISARTPSVFTTTCNGSPTNNGATVKAYAPKRRRRAHGRHSFRQSAITAPMFSLIPNASALDWSGGAPPEPYFKDDEFTQKWGQNWGIPLYRLAANAQPSLRLVAAAHPLG